MSGLKRTSVSYDQRAHLNINIASLKASTLNTCTGVSEYAEQVTDRKKEIRNDSIRRILAEGIGKAVKEVERTRKAVEAVNAAPSDPMDTLRSAERVLSEQHSAARMLSQKLAQLTRDAAHVDESIATIAEVLANAEETMRGGESQVRAVDSVRYQTLSKEYTEIKKMLSKHVEYLTTASQFDVGTFDKLSRHAMGLNSEGKSLVEIAQVILQIDKVIEDIQTLLRQYDHEFKRWVDDQRTSVEADVQGLIARTVSCKRNLRENSNFQPSVSRNILTEVEHVMAKVQATLLVVKEKEDRYNKRRYVAAALQDTCEKLGFRQSRDWEKDAETNPEGTFILTFDTKTQGLITFKIELNGLVESESCIGSVECTSEHSKLSDALLEEFGVSTKFVADEDSDPLDMEDERRNLPRSSARSV